jgi:hypothetical protein
MTYFTVPACDETNSNIIAIPEQLDTCETIPRLMQIDVGHLAVKNCKGKGLCHAIPFSTTTTPNV